MHGIPTGSRRNYEYMYIKEMSMAAGFSEVSPGGDLLASPNFGICDTTPISKNTSSPQYFFNNHRGGGNF